MPTIIDPKNIYEYIGASYRINTNLQVQKAFKSIANSCKLVPKVATKCYFLK